MQSAFKTTVAMFLSFLLAFGMPASALAETTGDGVPASADPKADTAELPSYEDEATCLRWYYELREDGVYIVGCEAFAPKVPEADTEPVATEDPSGGGEGGESETTTSEGKAGGDGEGAPASTEGSEASSENSAMATGEVTEEAPQPEQDSGAETGDGEQVTASDGTGGNDGDSEGGGGGETGAGTAEAVLPVDIEIPEYVMVEDAAMPVRGIATRSDADENPWASFESIAVSSNVKVIDSGAFNGCDKLRSVTFGENSKLAAISDEAFARSGIEKISLPGALEDIGEYAFSTCNDLEAVSFASQPAAIEIGTGAFSECAKLESVSLPNALASVSESLFYGCEKLGNVALPSTVARIGANAFAGSGIKSVEFPAALSSVGESAFAGCASLESASFEHVSDIAEIPAKAFDSCSKLASVTLPSSLTGIGEGAFSGCAALATTNISSCDKLARIEEGAFRNSGIQALSFPASVERVCVEAFAECGSLRSVVFPTDVKSSLVNIEYGAFYKCASLATVVLPSASGLPCIADGVFYGTALTSVDIPDSVTEIFAEAFRNCKALKEVTGCRNVKSIADYAFAKSVVASLPDETYAHLRFLSATAFKDCPDFAYDDASLNAHGLYRQGSDYYRFDTKVSLSGTKSYKKAGELLKRVNEERGNRLSSSDAGGQSPSTKESPETGQGQPAEQPAAGEQGEPVSTVLVMDSKLQEAAMVRASELPVYFSESKRPTGLEAGTVIEGEVRELDVVGVSSVTGVLNTLKSSGKDTTLYDAGFQSVGIGCFMHNGTYYWTVLLSSEASEDAASGNGEVATSVEVGLRSEATECWPYLEIAPVSEGTNVQAGQTMRLILKCSAKNNPRFSARIDIPSSAVFYSATPSVAQVDQRTGVVTFLAGGQAEIRASLMGGEDNTDLATSYTFNVAARDSVENAEITGLKNAVYTGKAAKQAPKVTLDGKVLEENVDYTLSYENNVNAGKATVTVAGMGQYDGAVAKTFKITKSKQSMSIKKVANTVKVKRGGAASVVKVSKYHGNLTYKNASKAKKAKKLAVGKNGKVKVPKGSKPGAYKLTVKVSASGDGNYKAASKTITVKLRVM